MKKICRIISILTVFLVSTSAFAQATRTWVSGVGDDANPCSRTAPCKTWAGAISKTAAGGEIDALDSGGFGTLNITKSITIEGNGVIASALASGTTGFIVNGAGINVILRNITINGAGTTLGTRGVRVLQAARVILDNVDIINFSERGVSVETSVATRVQIQNCRISNPSSLASGVTNQPSAGTPANTIVIVNSDITNNGQRGVFITNGGNVTIKDSNISHNTTGVSLEQSAGGARANLDNNVISHNGTGVSTQASCVMLLSRNAIFQNTTAGFNVAAVTAFSYGDNYIDGNAANVGTLNGASEQ